MTEPNLTPQEVARNVPRGGLRRTALCALSFARETSRRSYVHLSGTNRRRILCALGNLRQIGWRSEARWISEVNPADLLFYRVTTRDAVERKRPRRLRRDIKVYRLDDRVAETVADWLRRASPRDLDALGYARRLALREIGLLVPRPIGSLG